MIKKQVDSLKNRKNKCQQNILFQLNICILCLTNA